MRKRIRSTELLMVLFGSASVLVLDVSGSRYDREGATLDKTSGNIELVKKWK